MGVVNMVRLTVSGHPGSGTSTLVHGLMERFGWDSLNGGDVFREEAKRRNMSLAAFGELCKNEPDVDRSLDALLKERMQGENSAHTLSNLGLRAGGPINSSYLVFGCGLTLTTRSAHAALPIERA